MAARRARAALSLGRRGYEVALADSGSGGGRIVGEAALPGLTTWRRVLDYRLGQIDKLEHVPFFLAARWMPTRFTDSMRVM